MRHNTNLYIGEVELKIQGRVVAATSLHTQRIVLTNIVVLETSDTNRNSHTDLWKYIDRKTWIEIQLRSKVLANGICAAITHTRIERRCTSLNQEFMGCL